MPARTSRSCCGGGERADRHAVQRRVADLHPRRRSTRSSRTCSSSARGDEDATDGRALLAGLLGHVARRRRSRKRLYGSEPGGDVRAEDGGVQAVGLDVDAHRAARCRPAAARARPVSLEPVKASTSCPPRWVRRSPGAPVDERERAAREEPASTMSWTMRHVTSAVLVAGLATTGMPARRAHAAFSPRPQAGKLKALTCTATPWRGTLTCWPKRRGAAAELDAVAVERGSAGRPAPCRGRRRRRACRRRRRCRTWRRCGCCRRS